MAILQEEIFSKVYLKRDEGYIQGILMVTKEVNGLAIFEYTCDPAQKPPSQIVFIQWFKEHERDLAIETCLDLARAKAVATRITGKKKGV